MPIANWVREPPPLLNWKLEIGNWKFLLGHLRRMRTVFFEHARGRKFPQLVPHHVLGDEDGIEGLSVMHQKCVANKVRRHHRAARPRLDRFFCARRIYLVDLLQEMRLDEGSFL
jgi:hypothetical protein